jgi:hypothetical protein
MEPQGFSAREALAGTKRHFFFTGRWGFGGVVEAVEKST